MPEQSAITLPKLIFLFLDKAHGTEAVSCVECQKVIPPGDDIFLSFFDNSVVVVVCAPCQSDIIEETDTPGKPQRYSLGVNNWNMCRFCFNEEGC